MQGWEWDVLGRKEPLGAGKTHLREVNDRNQMMVNTMFTAVGKAQAVEQKILIFHWSGCWEEFLMDS